MPTMIEWKPKKIRLEHGVLTFLEKGQGRPYLLLNGPPFGALEFADVLDVLSWSSRAIAIDLPGLGGSELDRDPSLDDMTSILVGALATLGIDGAVLAATDVAGPLACHLIEQCPSLFAGALFFNTAIDGSNWSVPPYVESGRTRMIDLLRPSAWLEQAIVGVMGKGDRLDGKMLEIALSNLTRPRRRCLRNLINQIRSGTNGACSDTLNRFGKPVRVLWGKRDPLFTAPACRAFSHNLPSSAISLTDTGGHFLALEEPDLLTQTLQELGREAWG